MDVTSRLSVKRLNGDEWFRKKPKFEVRSTYDMYNKKLVRLWFKLGPFEATFDLSADELRRAIDYAEKQ